MHHDIFNGDADGILALLQLRLAEPKQATLVTGVKRDIALVNKLDPKQVSSATILDISMEKNIQGLESLLAADVPVQYFDHHRSGDIPNHPQLNATINTDANVCTALLVNDYLAERYPLWAVAAAFGDNLVAVAQQKCQQMGLDSQVSQQLKQLGICVNYNGYGRTVADLHYAPDQLFNLLLGFESPLDLFADTSSVYYDLNGAYEQDMSNANKAQVISDHSQCKVLLLPDQPWSHRVSGVFGNAMANQAPDKAHAVLTENADGRSYTVSVRAPLNNKQGADKVCCQFPTGGGRAGAAGINKLEHEQLQHFIDVLAEYYR